MIYVNGKLTTWVDTPENLVRAAHETVFYERKELDEVKSDKGYSITEVLREYVTQDEIVKNAALELGYWVSPAVSGGWAIHLDWSQDPNNPPNKDAIHI